MIFWLVWLLALQASLLGLLLPFCAPAGLRAWLRVASGSSSSGSCRSGPAGGVLPSAGKTSGRRGSRPSSVSSVLHPGEPSVAQSWVRRERLALRGRARKCLFRGTSCRCRRGDRGSGRSLGKAGRSASPPSPWTPPWWSQTIWRTAWNLWVTCPEWNKLACLPRLCQKPPKTV